MEEETTPTKGQPDELNETTEHETKRWYCCNGQLIFTTAEEFRRYARD